MAVNAVTASQISYQDAVVDFPVISTESWHLASTVQWEPVKGISAFLEWMVK